MFVCVKKKERKKKYYRYVYSGNGKSKLQTWKIEKLSHKLLHQRFVTVLKAHSYSLWPKKKHHDSKLNTTRLLKIKYLISLQTMLKVNQQHLPSKCFTFDEKRRFFFVDWAYRLSSAAPSGPCMGFSYVFTFLGGFSGGWGTVRTGIELPTCASGNTWGASKNII